MIVPISHTQDTAGPMARTVADAAALLTVLSDRGTDYARSLDAGALKGARIGVVRGKLAGVSPAADAVGYASVRAGLERAGKPIGPLDTLIAGQAVAACDASL